jgi:aminopeptidase N
MMKDFVERFRNSDASTDDFRMVANEHFANTPIAKKYGVKDLNWFFSQWVYHTNLPSYKLSDQVKDLEGGAVEISGNVIQENAGDRWFMPIPIIFRFGGTSQASGQLPRSARNSRFR